MDIARDYTFGDTTGGPVFTTARVQVAAGFGPSDFPSGFYVDGQQCWADPADASHFILKWPKAPTGTLTRTITCPDFPGTPPFVLQCADPQRQPAIVGLYPATASLAGGSPNTYIDVICTGSGFSAQNVSEVFVSDVINSDGFSLPATHLPDDTIQFKMPTGNWPGATNWTDTMYVRSPNPGFPAEDGQLFTWTP
jgi:hypothetical protein